MTYTEATNCLSIQSPLADTDLLNHLVTGSLGPLSKLRDTVEKTIEQVSQWIDEPFNRHQITNLVTLLDAQTQLIICQQRLVAVARMVDVAMNAPGHETVRRACADLLKIRLVDPYKDDKRPVRTPPPPPVDADRVLDLLEKWGNEALGIGREEENSMKEVPQTLSMPPRSPQPQPKFDSQIDLNEGMKLKEIEMNNSASQLMRDARAARSESKVDSAAAQSRSRAAIVKTASSAKARKKLSHHAPENIVHNGSESTSSLSRAPKRSAGKRVD